MKVYEMNIRTYLKRDLSRDEVQEKISLLVSDYMGRDILFNTLHETRGFKPYCFSNLKPIGKEYKKDNLYSFIIRTIDETFLTYFLNGFENFENNYFKNININCKSIKQRLIKEVYTVNPVVIKDEKGYWRENKDISFFEDRLNQNLINKYNFFEREELQKEENFYNTLEIINKYPITTGYKGVKLLGDKLKLTINLDKESQDLIYLALGTGLLENNSVGNGFLAYTYL